MQAIGDRELTIEKNGDKIFSGQRARGLCGVILAMVAHGTDMKGSRLCCRFLSVAAAKLALLSGVREVAVAEVTEAAYSLLKQRGVAVEYEKVLDPSQYENTAEYKLEEISEEFVETSEFFEEMKRRLLIAVEYHIFPTDEILLLDLKPRLGVGGGGT
jgi:hypothetical protein